MFLSDCVFNLLFRLDEADVCVPEEVAVNFTMCDGQIKSGEALNFDAAAITTSFN